MYADGNPVNFIDPLGLIGAENPFTAANLSVPKEIVNATREVYTFVHQPKVQAGLTLVAGTIVAGVGVYTGNAAMIKWGIPVAAHGLVTSIIEFGLKGDTSNLPSNELEILIDIGKGACENK